MNRVFTFLGTILVLWSLGCARIAAPSGGPVDKEPPQIVYVQPPMYSTNFDAKKIEIKFNEYIVLRNLNKNLLISPPSIKKPEVKISGKKLIISLPDSLQRNTTYTMDFGNAIADFTEGNVLKNFKYVFSTGPMVDSLALEGRVYDAFLLEPEKDMLVGLYYSLSDSIPYHTKPQYITRIDDNGHFKFSNLKDSAYYVFALSDKNNNYIYDLPTEKIGFYPLPIKPYSLHNIADTIKDSVAVDSNKVVEIPTFYEYKNKKFYIKKYFRKYPWKLTILFNEEMDTIPIAIPMENVKDIAEISKNNDSLQIWILDTTKIKNDTISYVIRYYDNHEWQDDTLAFAINNKKYKSKPLAITLLGKPPLSPFDTMMIETSEPIGIIDTTKILFYYQEDTLRKNVKYSIIKEFRKLKIIFDKQTDIKYHLIIDSAAIQSIYRTTNDSIAFDFGIRNEDDYSKLIVEWKWQDAVAQIIIQLTDAELKKVIRQSVVSINDTATVFNHLLPNKYAIRIIYDTNVNGKWDAGDLLLGKMPERVLIKKDIKIKQGWDNVISLKLGKNAKE